MSGKSKSDYKGVFYSLKIILGGETDVEEVLTDFDVAIWQRLRFAFPEIRFKGCAFHWVQAVNRKLRDLGLLNASCNDEGTRAYCRRLFGLPLAPHELIPGLFNALKEEASDPLLETLCSYIESTWVVTRIFVPASWSVMQNVRTNNDVEGWHNRLNWNAGRRQTQLYLLLKLLHDEAQYVDVQTRLVQSNNLRRMERKEYRDLNIKIHKIWSKFSTGDITDKQLLASCGRIYAPTPKPEDPQTM